LVENPPPDNHSISVVDTFTVQGSTYHVFRDNITGTEYLANWRGGFIRLDRTMPVGGMNVTNYQPWNYKSP
jgi:hypothetical protein